ncbi:hypothetical protein [Shewanella sp. GXUN23E]|uniref:hypothetical protein n=1 Tax=Shewanella sp. GXUN23E TaxID=3422498 RepID=UPI003D7D7210
MFPYPDAYRQMLPPLTTVAMIMWAIPAALIFPDGSAMANYPLFMLFALVLVEHLYLIWQAQGMSRLDQCFYALVHCPLAFVVWTFSIMHVGGKGF